MTIILTINYIFYIFCFISNTDNLHIQKTDRERAIEMIPRKDCSFFYIQLTEINGQLLRDTEIEEKILIIPSKNDRKKGRWLFS